MNKNTNEEALIIYGPTATGKTALAIDLAKKFNGELISADSRQVYKSLDIGTGKVHFHSEVEKRKGYWIVDGIKINGFDLVKPGQRFTVADFIKFTNTTMIRIIEQKSLPIIVGGTGFYIKSLLEGLGSQGIPSDPSLRRKLEKLSREELFQYLLKINHIKVKSLNESDRLNPRRLIRAIEISESKDSPLPATNYPLPTTRYQLIGLTAPNAYLFNRADLWLKERLGKGLMEEVEKLLSNGVSTKWLINLGLEYRWITRCLKNEITQNYAIERLKGDIHNFIRRQKTWFKQFENIKIYDISQPEWQSKLEKDVRL